MTRRAAEEYGVFPRGIRESSARIEPSELAAQLLVVYDYRGEDTEMRTPARRRVAQAAHYKTTLLDT